MGVILEDGEGGQVGMICGGGGGGAHELVRDDHVLCVCWSSFHASSSL